MLNAKAKCVLCHLACPLHDPKGVNCKRARLLQWGHPEVVVDQPNGNTQVIMLVALLLKRALHFGELLL
jgi:hypothetical protein